MPIIQSVERALRILDLFDEYHTEIKITDISEQMGLHKSTVHSLLKTLQKHHYIEQNPENGKYHLGLKLFERGQYVIQSRDLRSISKEHLINLSRETGKTVHLVILDGIEGVYIEKVESSSATIVYSKIGKRVPIHSSGVGKALVAFLKTEEIERILDGYEFTPQTPQTITSHELFLQEIERIREIGYAIDNQENEPGVYCVAMPIRDYSGQAIAAISISGTSTTVTKETVKHSVELLTATTQEISKKLGFGF
ncbi:IclR family transcriptional regulator [Bacillus solitudinis]|uniref:IclR family transcriptional regulator n=1 Tax=Bacillus solitudinis TaxID=2014074 RepID=UPI000C248857|nr:IclR family transcriptional regulator [Bacillus solitudinis]